MVPLHIAQKRWTASWNPFFGVFFERAKRVDEQEFLKAQVQLSSKQYQQKLKLAKENIQRQPRNFLSGRN